MIRILRNAMLLVLLTVAGVIVPGAGQTKQKVVVHLTHFTDNLHAAKMAMGMASRMQALGAEVTLVLDLEGVRLANKREPQDVVWGGGEPLSKTYDSFIRAGGKVVLCPHCAHHAGIAEADLRPGARIGKEDDLAKTMLDAAKVLDY